MSPAPAKAVDGAGEQRWRWPINPGHHDTRLAVRAAERRAIDRIGAESLRRLQNHNPTHSGWAAIGRLLRPLDEANAALDSPPTSHRRRAMHDAVAVVLLRCAQVGRSYWGWTAADWLEVIGTDQTAFRYSAPAWADEAVRPYLSAHAYLLRGFNDFNQLGSFSRLTLAWRVFGRARVDAEIKRIRVVLGDWGYRLAATTTSCYRWWPAKSFFSTAALTSMTSTQGCSPGSAAGACCPTGG
jgi:hypothetical protein